MTQSDDVAGLRWSDLEVKHPSSLMAFDDTSLTLAIGLRHKGCKDQRKKLCGVPLAMCSGRLV